MKHTFQKLLSLFTATALLLAAVISVPTDFSGKQNPSDSISVTSYFDHDVTE